MTLEPEQRALTGEEAAEHTLAVPPKLVRRETDHQTDQLARVWRRKATLLIEPYQATQGEQLDEQDARHSDAGALLDGILRFCTRSA